MTWLDSIDPLRTLDHATAEQLLDAAQVVSVPNGTHLFGPGARPQNLLLVLSGTVRVQQVTESGREIVLYRVHAGESCIMTTACLLAGDTYAADGWTETDVTAVAIPEHSVDHLIASSAVFRKFVFASYAKRISDLFLTIEDIASRRIDLRLAQRLIDLADAGKVRATHQQLAAELGTVREVVSRQLSDFQRKGWISQNRGTVSILNTSALINLFRHNS